MPRIPFMWQGDFLKEGAPAQTKYFEFIDTPHTLVLTGLFCVDNDRNVTTHVIYVCHDNTEFGIAKLYYQTGAWGRAYPLNIYLDSRFRFKIYLDGATAGDEIIFTVWGYWDIPD